MRPSPPTPAHRAAYLRLHVLTVARTIGPGFLAGMPITALPATAASGNPTYEMPVGSNRITFEENRAYALQVDWR
jgi:hypothetical protein